MTGRGGVIWCILAAVLLAGCPDQKRQAQLDAHDCYEQDQRAVIICNTDSGDCRVECREKGNE